MISACKSAGSPAPEWKETGFRMRVTLRSSAETQSIIDTKDTAILNLLDEAARGLSTRDIAVAIELSVRAIRTRLLKLIERGLIVDVGKGSNDPGKRYYTANI